jgi:hypothetical protein
VSTRQWDVHAEVARSSSGRAVLDLPGQDLVSDDHGRAVDIGQSSSCPAVTEEYGRSFPNIWLPFEVL